MECIIQVCYDISSFGTRERELRSLMKASDDLSCSNLIIITWDKDDVERISEKEVRFVPLWRWLIAGEP